MWAFFALSLSAIAVTIACLLRRYAARDVPVVVLLATAYAWLVSFGVIALVPIDVWTTLVRARRLEGGGAGDGAGAGGGADAGGGGIAQGGGAAGPPAPPAPPSPGGGAEAAAAAAADVASARGLNVLWGVAYWSTQALTWLLLPFFQVYSDAGDFTAGARCLTSLRENGALYGAAAGAGALGLATLAIAQGGVRLDQVAGLGMALSNTFGLCAGMLLLGYGLVQVPREAWRTASPEQELRWCAHRAGRLAPEVIRRTNELETVVTVVCANARQVPARDPLRPLVDAVAARAEDASPVKPSDVQARGPLDLESLSADDLEYHYDLEGLAALRRRLNAAVSAYAAAHAQYGAAVAAGVGLEAVVKARQRGDYSAEGAAAAAAAVAAATGTGAGGPRGGTGAGAAAALGAAAAPAAAGAASSLAGGAAPPSASSAAAVPAAASRLLLLLPRLSPRAAALAWRLRCTAAPAARKLLALLLAALSLAVVWSELTIFTGRSPDLSPFSLAVRAASPGEWSTQALTLLPLAYVCGCVYFALFRLNAFDYNKLCPGATTGAGLMQNGSLMARFAAPTCWNFLHVVHMDGVVASAAALAAGGLGAGAAGPGDSGGGGGGVGADGGADGGAGGAPPPMPPPSPPPSPSLPLPPRVEVTTVFTRNMGTMAVLPVLGRHLNVWLPALLAAHCALIYFGTWDRLAAAFAPARYRFAPDDSAADDAYTERGRALIRREGECCLAGMRVGDLLHGPGLEREFPDLARRRVRLGGAAAAAGRGGRGGGGGGGGPLAWLGLGRRNGGGGGGGGSGDGGGGPALSSAALEAQLRARPLPPSVSSSPTLPGAEERRPLWGGGGGGGGGSTTSSSGPADAAAAAGGGGNGNGGGAGRSLLSSLLANRYASPAASPSSEMAAASALGSSGGGGGGGGGGNGRNGGGGGGGASGGARPATPAGLDSLFEELGGGARR